MSDPVETFYIFSRVLRQVAPLGLSHYASEDDEYNGFFIPKGTFVLSMKLENLNVLHQVQQLSPTFGKYNPQHDKKTLESNLR